MLARQPPYTIIFSFSSTALAVNATPQAPDEGNQHGPTQARNAAAATNGSSHLAQVPLPPTGAPCECSKEHAPSGAKPVAAPPPKPAHPSTAHPLAQAQHASIRQHVPWAATANGTAWRLRSRSLPSPWGPLPPLATSSIHPAAARSPAIRETVSSATSPSSTAATR